MVSRYRRVNKGKLINNAMCNFYPSHLAPMALASFEEEHGEAVATASPCSSSKEWVCENLHMVLDRYSSQKNLDSIFYISVYDFTLRSSTD
ncbi:hypothetical protein KDA_58310 [Dictyobacter alpinus]|uniref:Uncharacterized protein n=1 Tax=Dictyobacter alpinus TaxID=2014873 RepID=A0A402BGF2_9CHLR|nr:hypothetical protein KDA_57990 [Dictyobacter alpinus]GCE30347.1 hypothetical protein KDA_58310 [Dictyobacter alpinus]